MHVICPLCQKAVTLPDSAAGQMTPCPACHQSFTAPTLMPAEPAPTPAPPPAATYTLKPPEPRPAPEPAPAATKMVPAGEPAPANPPQEHKGNRTTISRKWVRWIGPSAVLLMFVLTFFTWVAAYAGTDAMYRQSAWGIMAGTFDANPTAEDVFGWESALQKASAFDPFMLIYVLLMVLLAAPIALAELLAQNIRFHIPDIMNRVWPHRLPVMFFVSLTFFLILTVQMFGGMGLEAAAVTVAHAHVTEGMAKPTGEENAKQKMVRSLKEAKAVNELGLRRTICWRLSYVLTIVAVIGFGTELWLRRRGDRPEPYIEWHC